MEDEIRHRLGAVLAGELSLAEFRAWLGNLVVEHPAVPPVVHEIEYLIDEAIAGNLDRGEARDLLAGLAETSVFA